MKATKMKDTIYKNNTMNNDNNNEGLMNNKNTCKTF